MGSKGKSEVVDRPTIAKALNLSERRISQLAGEGLPKDGRGKYPLNKCKDWYIRYLQKCLEKRSIVTPEGESGLAAVRLRRETAEAELKEMDLAKARRTLIAIEDVEKAMSDLVVTTKAKLLAVPSRISGQLVGLESQIVAHSIVDKSIREALAKLEQAE